MEASGSGIAGLGLPEGVKHDASTQTDSKQGQCPRLSKVNLFTLLSLWMELFPTKEQLQQNEKIQVKRTGLVIEDNKKITGLHCSSQELHAGQIAVIKHGSNLRGCNLYFSRKPCSACLKMIVNAGVNRISYWPADPEMSLLQSIRMNVISPDAELDAKAVERLKSNGRAHVSVLLQPLVCNMNHFVEETTKSSDFFQKLVKMGSFKVEDVFSEHKHKYLKEFEQCFLISEEEEHKYVLKTVGLENLCENPYFINLRQNMKDLILLLATVASGIPEHAGFGFYCDDLQRINEDENQSLPQGTARHCMIQARLLAYRTEDPKIGVGAVIWAEGKPDQELPGSEDRYLSLCYLEGEGLDQRLPSLENRRVQGVGVYPVWLIRHHLHPLRFRDDLGGTWEVVLYFLVSTHLLYPCIHIGNATHTHILIHPLPFTH
ncbi:cytidine and dCMP deaminase domain-containing protein 1 isoform X2 [Latimeria chalumnae]|uniref:cytidine and dCMP deaminase domain-containing protein 1 isoform X2 n=1 Tax=Latimeria chalumnae TaxID=7897 RepID=UPI00313EE9F5